MALLFNDHIFGDFFPMSQFKGSSSVWTPSVDISENDKQISLFMNLPGWSKDDVKIDIENNIIKIEGKHQEKTSEEGETWHRKERKASSFSRSFSLPDYTDQENVNAQYKDGVLLLSIPKKEQEEPKTVQIQ